MLALRLTSVGRKSVAMSPRATLALWPVLGLSGTIAAQPPHGVESAALTEYALVTKYGWVGDERTITWQHPGVADEFEIEIEHVENRIVQRLTATTVSVQWTPTRAGHYRVRVRARLGGVNSEWATSEMAGWWFFFWLKPPEF